MRSYFSYNDGLDITKGAFRISASQISRFFDQTSKWYHEFLLGESGFEGNTASHLGNCVHAGAEMYTDDGQIDSAQIEQYIASIADPEVDKTEIFFQYKHMLQALVSQYLSANKPTHTEQFVWHELLPGIGVGGSIDAYDEHKGIIIDYKTTSSKTLPKTFARSYWFQLMTYAWVLRQQGKKVDYIRLVYVNRYIDGGLSEKTGKPLKSYPSTVAIVQEPVTQDSLDLIGSCIQVIAESVDAWNKQPELRHLLAQDLRLKEKPKPKLFKD